MAHTGHVVYGRGVGGINDGRSCGRRCREFVVGAVPIRVSQGSSAVAALGFTAMMVGQLIGRSTADRFVDRYGQRTVIRTGGAIITAGMGIALIWPTIPLTLAGFGAAGLGAAALIPAAYNTADELPGLNPGVGLTVDSWFMRLGFLVTPPLVGALSDMFSLRWALLVVPVAGAVTFLLARVLPGRTEHAQ